MKEFYTIDNELWVRDGSDNRLVDDNDHDLINLLWETIRSNYSDAFSALSKIYSKASIHTHYYKYLIVKRFCKCNFGNLDTTSSDIDNNDNFHLERVACPLRGECKYECVVCLPKLTSTLTLSEKRVMALVCEGKTKDEVAEELFISPNTVKTHIQSSYRKTNCKNRSEFINYAHNVELFKNC